MVDLVVARHPVHTLLDLLAQGGHMAAEAGGVVALGTVQRGHHGTAVGHLVAPLVDTGLIDLGLIGGEIGVHGSMADRVAEARLLVPHEKASAGHHEHGHDHADDHGPLLALLLRRGGLLDHHVLCDALLFFGHALHPFIWGSSRHQASFLSKRADLPSPADPTTRDHGDAI